MKIPFLFLGLIWASTLFAQPKLPIIRANSKSVSIRDGSFLSSNSWTLTPDARPDLYTADRSRKSKWVVFYTDIDSIRTKVKPGTSFDFIILLNGKDTCYTRIASAIPPEPKAHKVKNTRDTIPFILTERNAIHVKAVINEQDTVNLHFDVGSFDFRLTQDAIVKKTGLLANQPEALTGRAKPNFNQLEPVRKIQLGKVLFLNPEVVPTLLTAREMDGRFGWNLFEGKSVEIDYDQGLLIIHSKLPKNLKGYRRSNIEFLQSFVCIKSALVVKHKAYKGLFLFDTGSDQALILDSLWVARSHFPRDLPLIKTTVFSDPRGVKYESKTVLCPRIETNGISLQNIPATLLGSKNPVGFEVNYLGNDALKRFNIILDFRHDRIYLKPNSLLNMPFREAKV